MKHLILSLSVAAALAGCAGGSGVAKHDVDVTIPTLNAVNPSKILGDATNDSGTPIEIVSLHTGSGGSAQYAKISIPNPYMPWDDEVNRFLYVTPDGRKYSFENGFTGPVDANRWGSQIRMYRIGILLNRLIMEGSYLLVVRRQIEILCPLIYSTRDMVRG